MVGVLYETKPGELTTTQRSDLWNACGFYLAQAKKFNAAQAAKQ